MRPTQLQPRVDSPHCSCKLTDPRGVLNPKPSGCFGSNRSGGLHSYVHSCNPHRYRTPYCSCKANTDSAAARGKALRAERAAQVDRGFKAGRAAAAVPARPGERGGQELFFAEGGLR